jgi:biopolymer transport protein ExbD
MKLILVAVLAFGSVSGLLAQEQPRYAPLTLAVASSGKPTASPDQVVTLVVDRGLITYESTPISYENVITYVDTLLVNNKAANVLVYVRAGTKYGEAMKALDLLRQTNAKAIGINPVELSFGREI